MGLALFKERRLADRRRLTGLLPGRLQLLSTGGDLICRPVDVSMHGIGIVVTAEKKLLQAGAALSLFAPDCVISLSVAWSRPDFGKQDSIRYGLVTADSSIDLLDLFSRHGCLR